MNQESEHLKEIRSRLAAVADDRQRMSLLNELAYELHRSAPDEALPAAKQALNIAASLKDRSEQANSYRIIGITQLYRTRFRAAESALRKSLRISRRFNDDAGTARALGNLGVVYIKTGKYIQAVEVLQNALEYFQSDENPSFVGMVCRNLGVVYANLGDYPRALDCYVRSLKLKEEVGESIAGDLNNIGTIHYVMRNYEKALDYFNRAAEMHRAAGDRRGLVTALLNIGVIHAESERGEEGFQTCLEALKVAEALGDRHIMGTIQLQLAGHYHAGGQVDEMERCTLETLELARELEDKALESEALFRRAQAARMRGRYREALSDLHAALNAGRNIGYRDSERDIYRAISEIHEHLGELKEAFEYYRKFVEAREELLGQEKQNAMAEIQARAEMETAEKEREILRLKSEKLELEMEHKGKELTTLAMQLVQKNEFLDTVGTNLRAVLEDEGNTVGHIRRQIQSLLRDVDLHKSSEREWETFEQQFKNIHEDFIDALARAYPDLSPTELKVCALLKINLSTKDIANMLCASPRTVEHHRYKIRTKLGLDKKANLSTFLAGR